ncbi:MAG: uroporphyrinogen-III synthase [Bacteroidia bacterium]|nr:uroporphyrinogen-III synthase [Bacteroidia bacterium]MDW8088415.1 uroporphyrinogen-III synthase [Bacteroidia bacterium]
MRRVRNILITLPPPPSDSPYYELARVWKVQIYFANIVEIQGMTLAEFREQNISPLDYEAFIFSGKQAIDHFFRLMQEMRLELPKESRFLCVGEAVAQHLYNYIPGVLRRRTYAQAHSLTELIPYMRKHAQYRYLYVGGGIAPLQFFEEAARYHLSVATVRVYNVKYLPLPEALRRKKFSVICFPSVASVLAWKALYPNYKQGDTAVLVFGSDTLRVAENAGIRVLDYAPREHIASLLSLISHFLQQQAQRARPQSHE